MRLAVPRCLAIAVALLTAAAPAAAQETVRVIALEAAVHLRSDSTSPIVLKVGAGTLLDIAHRDGDWYAVLLPADPRGLRRFGYVAANATEPLERSPGPKPTANAFIAPTPLTRPVESAAPAAAPALRIDETDWAREGTFVSVSVPFHRVRGGREDILINGSDLLIVPTLKSNYGVAFSVGHSFRASAVELSYERSTHASTAAFSLRIAGLPSVLVFEEESVYNRVHIDFKRYLVRRWRLQPYLQLGFGFPWLQVKRGGLVQGSVVDATFNGIGGDGGAGVAFFVHPRIALHSGAVYRYDLYLSARGGGGNWSDIQDTITVHGLNVTTGVSFMF